MEFNELIAGIRDDLTQVEQTIFGQLNTEIPLINEIGQYILESGGKRLRPAIMIFTARMFNAPKPSAYRAASALEYLHTATLLHDDVVDEADSRRSQKAARLIWGNQASVLVGDYLLATALHTLTTLGNQQVMETISHTTTLMSKGEILQLLRSYDSATENEYLEIITNKTACLFAAAAKIGALFGGAPAEQCEALYQYGNSLGIAFQIVDDALDYVEERGKIGKPLGQDLKERKVTLPLSRLLEVAGPEHGEHLQGMLAKEEVTDEDIHEVVKLMQHYEVLPYTLAEARRYVAEAKAQLAHLPEAPERETLGHIADFVVDRDF